MYVVFEDRDPAWENRLVAEAGHGLRVSLVWTSGHRLDGVLAAEAQVPRSRDPPATALDDPESGSTATISGSSSTNVTSLRRSTP